MVKSKYRFNPESLSFDRIERSLRQKLFRFLAYLVSSVVLGGGFLLLISLFYDLPKERMLKRENQFLMTKYNILNKKMDQVVNVLEDIQNRDDNIYRVIFEAEPIPASRRMAGFGGVNRYADLEGYRNSDIVSDVAKRLDVILNRLYVQSTSYDEVFQLAKNNEEMMASIPSIRPIAIDEYKRIASYYRHRRTHPILKVIRPHTGVDFTAPRGTPVHVTGDGVVEAVKINRTRSGYGTYILVNHGFGYQTFYAHLDKVHVREGQKLKRGDIIGEVGNTGLSVAPHLHYEVRKNENAIDPINFFFQDITPEDYQRMIEYSRLSGQALD
jgi:murein DD-endopeptidase MepM/ murein hydrolase activator NlpD